MEVQLRGHRERQRWDDDMQAYEEALTETSWAPWYVVPADHKQVMQAMVARLLLETIGSFELDWPAVTDEQRAANAEARRMLEAEEDD